MVVRPSTGHQNPSYLPQFSPIYFHLNFFLSIPILTFISPSHPLILFVIKKFLSSPIPYNSEKKFFSSDFLPAQIPRTLYHRPFKNPFILSLNKYPLSRIILENSLQYPHENYFPELLKPPLDNINLLCYNIAREPEYSGPKGQNSRP